MKKKDFLIIIISLIVVFGMLLFITPETFIQNLQSFNKASLLLIVVLIVIDLFLRVLRWWILLQSQDHVIPFRVLIYPSFASNMANVFLPGRAGELIRLYALRDEYEVRYSVGLSVIVVEQVINMMALIMVSSIALGLMFFSGINFKSSIFNDLIPYAFAGSLVMIGSFLMLFIIDPNRFAPIFSFLPESIYSKIVRLIHTFSFGLKNIKSKFYIFWIALGSSIVIWLMEGFIIWVIAMEFISNQFEFSIAMFASTLGNLNFLFPVLPGAALQYEAFLGFVLSLSTHYSDTNAFAVGFTDRIIKSIILVILGGFSLFKLGNDTFDVIRKKTDEVKEIEQAKEEFAD